MAASEHLGPQFVEAYHVAPKFNRKSIAEKGILPSPNSMGEEEFPEHHTKGAFYFQSKGDLEHYYGDDSTPTDVWKGQASWKHSHQDPYIEDASYTTKPITNPQRVGHGTAEGIHWHPEENCPHCN